MKSPLAALTIAVVATALPAASRADVVTPEYSVCFFRQPGDGCGTGSACAYRPCYHPGSQRYGDAGERLGCLMCVSGAPGSDAGVAAPDAGGNGSAPGGGCSQGPSGGSALGAAALALAGGLGLFGHLRLRRRDP